MEPDDVEHAFDRFYRGVGARRARPEGLGLGLAIVKQVVDVHHGTISIESAIGHGTSVTIEIPLLQS
jgi:two-component system phosphate regulon sensor histidine kinase PhoR